MCNYNLDQSSRTATTNSNSGLVKAFNIKPTLTAAMFGHIYLHKRNPLVSSKQLVTKGRPDRSQTYKLSFRYLGIREKFAA
jgi:hypothetical protein